MSINFTPEDTRVQTALEEIDAFKGPRVQSYADLHQFQQVNNCMFLGVFFNTTWYVPRTITKEKIKKAAQIASPYQEDKHQRITEALKSLWLTTKHEKLDQRDREQLFKTYADQLQDYQLAPVLDALKQAGRDEKFFPAINELMTRVEMTLSNSARLVKALRFTYRKLN